MDGLCVWLKWDYNKNMEGIKIVNEIKFNQQKQLKTRLRSTEEYYHRSKYD